MDSPDENLPAPIAKLVANVGEEALRRADKLATEQAKQREQAARLAKREHRKRGAEQCPITSSDLARIETDSLDATDALDAVRKWIDESTKGRWRQETSFDGSFARAAYEWETRGPRIALVLQGGTGTGKTMAAAYALARLHGHYIVAEDLRRAFHQEHHRALEMRDRALAARFLVVDDIGFGKTDEGLRYALGAVVDGRMRDKLTVLLTNLTFGELKELLDPRTIDRLNHIGRRVSLDGESMRGRAK